MDLADLMASMGRSAAQPRRAAKREGEDMEHTVDITLAEASAGTTVMLDVMDGTVRRSLEVKIPAGVVQGRRVRLAGMGGKGSNGGENGSIYLNVQLKPDKVFQAKGHDLYFDLRLSPWEAILGAQIQVATLTGEVMLTVPAFTQAMQTLRLKGRGMQDGKGGTGDLYAKVNIAVPATLTAPQLALVEQLSKSSTFEPRGG
jgi:curved DNA-binding protein